MDLSRIPAYELVKEEELPDVASHGYLLRHKKSGARVMLLENEDENKVFNIAFRTTPDDSTGKAHIMEHSVLCGSRKFPSRDPFVELVKGSMNTFLNAMTYPDKTMFPVASTNDRDFANLMDVYLDAVFYPNIYKKEEIFRQEGWSYVIEKPEDDLVVNGVVYNEMKGVYSSADDILDHEINRSLFPDNTYFFESGGYPADIPNLTYEEFLNFHRKYYHPSNSYIYLYGKMDYEERLNFLDSEYLRCFDCAPVASAIALQKPFPAMRRVVRDYPAPEDGEDRDNTYFAYSTVVATSLDTKLANAMAVLEYALLEAPGAPVKKALIDAGVAGDIDGSYDSGIYQPVFSIIARGADPSNEDKFMSIIRGTLQTIVSEGVNEKALRAGINSMEFKFREADYGRFPKGLIYGLDVFDSWLYDDDMAFSYLHAVDDFDYLKKQVGTGYFEKLIDQYLIYNPHSSLIIMNPKKGMTAREDQAQKEKLSSVKASMSAEDIETQIEKTKKLRAFQETPSTQEELEKIPMLSRKDLRREALPASNETMELKGTKLIRHDYWTNGIAYISILFDMSQVSPEDLPYAGLLKNVIGSVDTEHYSYTDLSNEINMNTGGISPVISVFPDAEDTEKIKAGFGITIRTLEDKIPYSFDMARELLFTSKLTDEKRVHEIIRHLRSRLETALSAAGSSTAAARCAAHYSAAAWVNDQIDGIAFYDLLRDLDDHFEDRKSGICERMQKVLHTVLDKGDMLVSYTGSGEALSVLCPLAENLAAQAKGAGALPAPVHTPAQESFRYLPVQLYAPCREGFKTPGQVQYVARCGNFVKEGYTYNAALKVLSVIMSYDYLWSQLRVVGGAYGCSGSFARNGNTTFASYRDPHCRRTNQIYDGIPEYIRTFTVEPRDMTKYVIGTISGMDTPLTPADLGARSMAMLMDHVTYESLQKERDQVLNCTQEDIRALADMVEAALKQNNLTVLGSEQKLEEEKDLFDRVSEL